MTLKDLRHQSQKTAAEVAEVLGIASSSYYNYENGFRRISIEQVLALSDFYNETAEEIIKAQVNSCQCAQANSRQ